MADISAHVRTDYKAVDKRDELHSVMGWLTSQTDKVPIVMDRERPFGILNERALMARSLNGKTHIEGYTLITRAMPGSTAPDKARDRMAEFRAAYLPIEDGRGKLAGYVRAVDLAREWTNGQKAADLAVPVTLLREDQSLGEALNAFAKEYVDYLPVARADGRLTGVLPRRTVLRMEFNTGDKGRKDAGGEKFSILRDPIAGVMDDAPNFVAPQTGYEDLLETIEETGYAIVRQPDGALRGLVTPETLFRPNGR